MSLNISSLAYARASAQKCVSGNTTLLDNASAATFEAWIKYDSLTASQHREIISKNVETSFGVRSYGEGAATVSLWLTLAGKAGNTAAIAMTTNAWHHIAFVFDGSLAEANRAKLWLDGVSTALTVESGFPASITASNTPINIGSLSNDDVNYYWDGHIDEVRIWNTARTEAQIQANYQKQLTGSESGLVAYWKFNENTGSISADSTGSLTLTLTNTPTWSTDVPFVGTPDNVSLLTAVEI